MWRGIPNLLMGLVFALPAFCRAEALVPNDPRLSQSWHIEKLGLPNAWGYSLGSPNVIAAVLDTGVMASTTDLAGRLLPAVAPAGASVMDGTAIHHGTWVASILGMG